jgi:hypothetical protein
MTIDAFEARVPLQGRSFLSEAEMVVLLIKVLLAVSEVNYKDLVLFLAKPHHKIGRIHVVIDQSFGVNPLDTVKHLVSNQQHCFERKSAVAVLKKLVERGTEYFSHQRSVVILDPVP